MQLPSTLLAHAITEMVTTTTAQHPLPPPVIALPSESMRNAMQVITLSDFWVMPGPEFECVLHGALFRSTERLYDL